MEDGKKKKKNKKNKGKPTKTVDNVTPSSGESVQTGPEVNHESTAEQNQEEADTGIVGAPNASVAESEGELERPKAQESNLADLHDTIKDLQNNVISCIEKEASLERKIEILQNENESFIAKEISWNLKYEQLLGDLHSCSVKENLISGTVARLEEANIGLQMQVKELERSRDNLVRQNQQLRNSISVLEARVQHVESEAASFRSSTVMITKHISEDKDTEKQVEPASEPSEKLVSVEPELVGRVTEPSEKLVSVEPELVGRVTEPSEKLVDQQNGIAEHSVTFGVSSTESDAIALPATYLLPHGERISESTNKFAPSATLFETINITEANVNQTTDAGVDPEELPLLDELNGSTEIVQIPLDDNQVQPVVAQDIKNDEKGAVPLSDAPLIGAPFRLISFVAKYVSGADLVKENAHDSVR